MAPERRTQVILAVMVAALGLVSYRTLRPSGEPAPTSNETAVGQPAVTRNAPASAQAPTVHLPDLDSERPKPGNTGRNLFRFKPKPLPPPPMTSPPQTMQTPTGPAPPTTPPITLKFIGVVEQGPSLPKIAVLSDGAGHVFQGPEGKIIDGRYRILHIGNESIEMAYLDGSGRRTIRLTGS